MTVNIVVDMEKYGTYQKGVPKVAQYPNLFDNHPLSFGLILSKCTVIIKDWISY